MDFSFSCCSAEKTEAGEESGNTVQRLEVPMTAAAGAMMEEAASKYLNGQVGGETYTLLLVRESEKEPLGLELDCQEEGCCLVQTISNNSHLARVNTSNPPDLQVQPNDRLMSVDGIQEESSSMRRRLMGTNWTQIELRFLRPRKYVVTVQKDPMATIGILAYATQFSQGIAVMDIRVGLVQEWNLSAPPDATVKTGDRILAVNGVEGKGTDLLEKISNARGQLDMTIATWS
eukprot:TRINITY_DN70079_c0_g1_i1.p1 TRINITY_DN70079_c0_g1~~TRINITY_DN70079_c0_g1_i1.p1  ORF type:complete len:232 (+),score=42.91 TRINITY_DN70079_c0_g1_i1:49-744(+)